MTDSKGLDISDGETLVLMASMFAAGAHAALSQKRKFTGEDYIGHPRKVSMTVEKFGGGYEERAAAMLHDVTEDTDVTLDQIREIFGSQVAALVYWCTEKSTPEDGTRKERKAIDREHYASGPPESQNIKLADMLDNNGSIIEHDPKFARIYLEEKKLLAEALTRSNPELRRLCLDQIHDGLIKVSSPDLSH